MALKITLKPNERMIIGGAVVTNGETRADFTIDNKVPLLRQKDIMSENEANSSSLNCAGLTIPHGFDSSDLVLVFLISPNVNT